LRFEDLGNILTLTFGIVSIIVTLVGLSAIFIALNMQQNVQKLRDIYWRLFGFSTIPNGDNTPENEGDLVKFFRMYEQVYKNDNKPTKFILKIVLFTLSITILILAFVGLYVMPYFLTKVEYIISSTIVIIGITVLATFIYSFKMLNNVSKSSELPSPIEVLDVNYKKDIRTLLIAGHFMKLRIFRWEEEGSLDRFQILVGFPLAFTNLEIDGDLFIGKQDLNSYDDYCANFVVLPSLTINNNEFSSRYCHVNYLDDIYWYNVLTNIRVPEDRDYLRIELRLSTSEEVLSVYYDLINISDLYRNDVSLTHQTKDLLNTIINFPKRVYLERTTILQGNSTKEHIKECFWSETGN